MSRLATTGSDGRPIPEDIRCLLTLANFARGWAKPKLYTIKTNTLFTCQKIIEAQARDPRWEEIRKELNKDTRPRFEEPLDGLEVRLAPSGPSCSDHRPQVPTRGGAQV